MNKLYLIQAIFYHGWKSVSARPLRTALICFALTLLMTLPFTLSQMVDRYADSLMTRAESTPRFVAAEGSRFDRLLQVLHFDRQESQSISYGEVKKATHHHLGEIVPIYVKHSISDYPLVAVSPAYYTMRQLVADEGTLPRRMGDCVVGAEVARQLSLSPGESLLTDSNNLFDLAGRLPVKVRITGILEKQNEADDWAFFCSLKTGWLVEGLAHGHDNLQEDKNAQWVLSRDKVNIVGNAAVTRLVEVTDENLFSFHFHGDFADYPITAFFLNTDSLRSQAILCGRINEDDSLCVFKPIEISEELIKMVLNVKKILDAVLLVSLVSVLLLFGLILYLSAQLRLDEFSTLYRMGLSRSIISWVYIWDALFFIMVSFSLSAIMSSIMSQTTLLSHIMEDLL